MASNLSGIGHRSGLPCPFGDASNEVVASYTRELPVTSTTNLNVHDPVDFGAHNQTVYEPTRSKVPPIIPYLESVWERRPLIWHLARTAMKSQHYDTVLGKVWVVIDPLLMAATFYFVRAVLSQGMSPADRNMLIAHLIMAISVFYYIQSLVTDCGRAIISQQLMVLHTSVPRGVFPAVALVRAVIDLIPAMGIYMVVHQVTGHSWSMAILWLPVIIFALTMFAAGVGLTLAPFIVYYRDVANVIPYMMRVWMYTTPVLFAVTEIPPQFLVVFRLNPLYPYYAMLDRIFFEARAPELHHLAAGFVYGAIMLTIGVVMFLRRERDYAVRL